MDVSFKSDIDFCANLISQESVFKKNSKTNKYSPTQAYFVELFPHNSKDLQIVQNLNDNWHKAEFISYIERRFSILHSHNDKFFQEKFYAITSQNTNIEAPDPNKILSIAVGTNMPLKGFFIDALQTNPKNINFNASPEVKGAGSAMLNGLKRIYNSISLSASGKTRMFYFKNGFISSDGLNSIFWEKGFLYKILTYLRFLYEHR